MPIEKMSKIKKIGIVVALLVISIPVASLTGGVCDFYADWAAAHKDSGFGRWLLYRVAWIHQFMGRKDPAGVTYGNFYETYKLPLEELPAEDERVAEARFQQAMAYYDRDTHDEENVLKAHRYFCYYMAKYRDSAHMTDERREKAQRFLMECETKARDWGYALHVERDSYPAEYGPYYEP